MQTWCNSNRSSYDLYTYSEKQQNGMHLQYTHTVGHCHNSCCGTCPGPAPHWLIVVFGCTCWLLIVVYFCFHAVQADCCFVFICCSWLQVHPHSRQHHAGWVQDRLLDFHQLSFFFLLFFPSACTISWPWNPPADLTFFPFCHLCPNRLMVASWKIVIFPVGLWPTMQG